MTIARVESNSSSGERAAVELATTPARPAPQGPAYYPLPKSKTTSNTTYLRQWRCNTNEQQPLSVVVLLALIRRLSADTINQKFWNFSYLSAENLLTLTFLCWCLRLVSTVECLNKETCPLTLCSKDFLIYISSTKLWISFSTQTSELCSYSFST